MAPEAAGPEAKVSHDPTQYARRVFVHGVEDECVAGLPNMPNDHEHDIHTYFDG